VSSPGGAGLNAEPPRVRFATRLRYATLPMLVAYLFRTIAGLAMVGPPILGLSGLLRRVPGGDRDILKNGGLVLFEALWQSTRNFGHWTRDAAIAAVVVAIVGLLPLAFLVVALAEMRPLPTRTWFSKGLRLFPTYFVLLGVAFLGEVVLFIVGVQAASVLSPPFDTPTHAWETALIVSAALLPLFVLGLLHDVARVVAVARGARFYDAASRAVVVARRRGFAIIAARILSALASLALIATGLVVPFALGLSSGARWIVATFVQELCVALLVVVRAAYFARLIDVERTA
jgi:hypothetical protein